MLRQIMIAILTLAFTLPAGSDSMAQTSARIFFNKTIQVSEEKQIKRHVVKRGEHLYQILRNHGIAEADLFRISRLTAESNPQIQNIDRLEPGQELIVPLSPDFFLNTAGAEYRQAPPAHEDIQTKRHTVRSGDRVVNLFRQAGLNDAQIFGEYLRRFREYNPAITDIDLIRVGQRIVIPLPLELAQGKPAVHTVAVSAAPAQAAPHGGVRIQTLNPLDSRQAAPGNEQEANGTVPEPPSEASVQPFELAAIAPPSPSKPPEAKKELTQADRRSFMLSLLRTIGFSFTPGEELLYPTGSGSWLKVDLARTPLGRSPWGEQYVFLPEELKNLERDFKDIGHEPVLVDEQWDPRKVLEAVSETSRGQFRTWPASKPLIVTKGGVTLELKASILARLQDRRILLINLLEPGDPPMPALLQGFFDRKGVHVHEWVRQPDLLPKPLQADLPRQEDLLVPWVNRYNAWPAIRDRLGEEARQLEPESADIDTVVAMLDRQGLVSRNSLRLSWYPGKEREMILTVPAVSINDGNSRLVVLGMQQASPHLVALLSLKGYTCLATR